MSVKPRPVTFLVTLGEVTLDVADVWPDGDAPQNPTAVDVADVMRQSSSGLGRLVTEWNLLTEVEVTDSTGRTEVVR